MQVTILGATGRIGSLVMTEALARGHDLISLSRRPPTEATVDRVETIVGDVAVAETQIEGAPADPKGCVVGRALRAAAAIDVTKSISYNREHGNPHPRIADRR